MKTAHTLGSDDTPSQYVPDLTTRSRPPTQNRPVPGAFPGASAPADDEDEAGDPEASQEVARRNLTFWQDGFSIEDGDLIPYEGNEEVLAAFNAGYRLPPFSRSPEVLDAWKT